MIRTIAEDLANHIANVMTDYSAHAVPERQRPVCFVACSALKRSNCDILRGVTEKGSIEHQHHCKMQAYFVFRTSRTVLVKM